MVARKPATEQFDEVVKKNEQLNLAMIDQAVDLLRAAGGGSGELRIKQLEKAIEIYKAVNDC